jgi:DNA-binding CsgD family transcriptional regulator
MAKMIRAQTVAAAGFILADSEWRFIYANPEAKRILTYPEDPRRALLARTRLHEAVFPLLAKQNPPSSYTFQTEVMSGRRKYACRAFPLTTSHEGRPARAAVAVVLERGGAASQVVGEVCERFCLTEREREVVRFLIQGFTNKEIAGRMKISPNTVRAFVRMVMVKLGVSTRSGIVGIVFRAMYTPSPS